MLLQPLLALAQFSAVLAQTLLPSPITGMSVSARQAAPADKTNYRWATWFVDVPFEFANAASISRGDYFEFSLTGTNIHRPDNFRTYDFVIESDDGDPLFRVVSDDGIAFTATATSFFDNRVASLLAGTFTVEYIVNPAIASGQGNVVNIDSFSDTFGILPDYSTTGRGSYFSFARQGDQVAPRVFSDFGVSGSPPGIKYSSLEVIDGVGFVFQPTTNLFGMLAMEYRYPAGTEGNPAQTPQDIDEGSSLSAVFAETRLDETRAPTEAIGVFQNPAGQFDDSGATACFVYKTNYHAGAPFEMIFCIEPGSGPGGVTNGYGQAAVAFELISTDVETSEPATSTESVVETTSEVSTEPAEVSTTDAVVETTTETTTESATESTTESTTEPSAEPSTEPSSRLPSTDASSSAETSIRVSSAEPSFPVETTTDAVTKTSVPTNVPTGTSEYSVSTNGTFTFAPLPTTSPSSVTLSAPTSINQLSRLGGASHNGSNTGSSNSGSGSGSNGSGAGGSGSGSNTGSGAGTGSGADNSSSNSGSNSGSISGGSGSGTGSSSGSGAASESGTGTDTGSGLGSNSDSSGNSGNSGSGTGSNSDVTVGVGSGSGSGSADIAQANTASTASVGGVLALAFFAMLV